MIREQLHFRLEQQRAEVARLESDLAAARQRYDSACITAARLPAGAVDRQADAEDENIKHYSQKLRGARLVLEQMETEQSSEGFAERVELADKLLAAVEAENFMTELERAHGERLAKLGAELANVYRDMFASIQDRQRRCAEALGACQAVGVRPGDGPRLFGSLLDVHALIAKGFWRGARSALPVRTSLNDVDLLDQLRGVLQRNPQ